MLGWPPQHVMLCVWRMSAATCDVVCLEQFFAYFKLELLPMWLCLPGRLLVCQFIFSKFWCVCTRTSVLLFVHSADFLSILQVANGLSEPSYRDVFCLEQFSTCHSGIMSLTAMFFVCLFSKLGNMHMHEIILLVRCTRIVIDFAGCTRSVGALVQ